MEERKVHLVPFVFLSVAHCGQYHFPLGLDVSPTHWKWNHSIGHYNGEGERGEGGDERREITMLLKTVARQKLQLQ